MNEQPGVAGRFSAFVAALAILAGLAACSGQEKVGFAPVPSPSSISAVAGPVIPEPVSSSLDVHAAPPPTSGPAVDKFGVDAVKNAYSYVIFLASTVSYKAPVMRDQQPSVEKLAFMKQYLTAETGAQWDRAVRGALRGEQGPLAVTQSLTSYATRGEGLTVNPSGDTVRNVRVLDPLFSVTKQGAMQVQVTSVVDLRMLNEQQEPVLVEQRKKVQFILVPNPRATAEGVKSGETPPLLIAGWGGELSASPVRVPEG